MRVDAVLKEHGVGIDSGLKNGDVIPLHYFKETIQPVYIRQIERPTGVIDRHHYGSDVVVGHWHANSNKLPTYYNFKTDTSAKYNSNDSSTYYSETNYMTQLIDSQHSYVFTEGNLYIQDVTTAKRVVSVLNVRTHFTGGYYSYFPIGISKTHIYVWALCRNNKKLIIYKASKSDLLSGMGVTAFTILYTVPDVTYPSGYVGVTPITGSYKYYCYAGNEDDEYGFIFDVSTENIILIDSTKYPSIKNNTFFSYNAERNVYVIMHTKGQDSYIDIYDENFALIKNSLMYRCTNSSYYNYLISYGYFIDGNTAIISIGSTVGGISSHIIYFDENFETLDFPMGTTSNTIMKSLLKPIEYRGKSLNSIQYLYDDNFTFIGRYYDSYDYLCAFRFALTYDKE